MYRYFVHKEYLKRLSEAVEAQLQASFAMIERLAEDNQIRVLRAYQKAGINESHFYSSTGYGYHDLGREAIDHLFASVFGAEAALVRPHFVSGTHAITTALFGLLRPGDELLYITGKPYDTLQEVTGDKGRGKGGFLDFGIQTRVIPLNGRQTVDLELAGRSISSHTRVVAMQRSRGYAWRPALSIPKIDEINRYMKEIKPDLVTFVDNCYGEFVEDREPTAVGVDLIAGSLIKNPGGGLAPSGGYVAGKKKWVDLAAARLTAPGLEGDLGATFNTNRAILQGFFLAPHVVGEALKGALFTSAVLERCGYQTSPHWSEKRSDMIQAVRFSNRQELLQFCQAIQATSPIDAAAKPVPDEMPGYARPVIMAAGTFIQGSSIELSCDAPLAEPYTAYLQGGLSYAHVKYAILTFIDEMLSKNTTDKGFNVSGRGTEREGE